MNLSLPKVNSSLLESRIKYRNNSINNINKKDKNETFHKLSGINFFQNKFNINIKTREYKYQNLNLQFFQKNAAKRNNLFDDDKIRQIRLIKSRYFHNDLIRKNVDSPLKREYKKLLSNLPNNKRCFSNLQNKDFDSIFKIPINITQPIIRRKTLISNKRDMSINTNKSIFLLKKKELNRPLSKRKINIHYKLLINSSKNNLQNNILNKVNKSCMNSALSIKKDMINFASIYNHKENLNNTKYLNLMMKLSKKTKIKLNLLNRTKKDEVKSCESISSSIDKYYINENTNKRKSILSKYFI